MKFTKIKNSIAEAVENLGSLSKSEDYKEYKDNVAEPVMPVSFTGAIDVANKKRKDASKAIGGVRAKAIKVVEADTDDRFKHMTDKEEKFNKGQKVTLDESLFESYIVEKKINEADEEEEEEITDISEFKPWSGAVKHFEAIRDAGKLDDLNDIVRELYPDHLNKQTLNDLLWFDYDFLKGELGMSVTGKED